MYPRQSRSLVPTFALTLLLPFVASAEDEKPETLLEQLSNGTAKVDLRYRFENVADDGFTKDAHASTLRTVLGYETGEFKGWSAYGEVENVTEIGNDLYQNRGTGGRNNGVTDRPVVADPGLTEINQAFIRYRRDDWKVSLGRQEIVLGDSRFVGNVGWRQNHQSFDALRVDSNPIEALQLTYTYLDRVHRIFGDDQDLQGHVLTGSFKVTEDAKLTAYGVLLDYEMLAVFGNSTATYGAEFAGRHRLSDSANLLYEVELAEQRDHGDNPQEIDSGYVFAMLGVELPRVTLKVGREVLEGGAGGRFTTPLATLHKFNGWADRFLATPGAGLEDLYLQANGSVGRSSWIVRYHDFSAEASSEDYGTELDLQWLYRLPSDLTLGLKGALYDADTFSVDTEKWMLWASYTL